MSRELGKHGDNEQGEGGHAYPSNTHASHEKSKGYAKLVEVLDSHIDRCMIEEAAGRCRLRKAIVEDNNDKQEGGHNSKD